MKKILFVASESVPFIKTGGLADVVGSIPKEFDKNEYEIRVVLPNYTCIPEEYRTNFKYIKHFYMNSGSAIQNKYVGILTTVFEGITYYFIDNSDYFNTDKPYGSVLFDIEKFSFFSKAALAILPVVNFCPDIIHCHDWQTGLIPVHLKTTFANNPFFGKIRTIMTIHNLKFQGMWNINSVKAVTGLPDYVFTNDKLKYYETANLLKGGLVYANYITTVSDTYAKEIQTQFYGEGLNGLLYARRNSLYGIVNGIDYDVYNPCTDKEIYSTYSINDFQEKKYLNKTGLQEELGLPVDASKFMIAIVSRLTDQKGLDLIAYGLNQIIKHDIQLVILGTGDSKYENMFKKYSHENPANVSANIFYSDNIAHKLYAAANALLMPSLFEPCGLSQLIALKYGTIPIVRETGGLKDTVEPYNEYENTGIGFSFSNYNGDELLKTINYAKHTFLNDKTAWNKLIERGMQKDYSWKASVAKYGNLYSNLIGRTKA